MPSHSKSMDNCEKLLVVDVIISFRWVEGAGHAPHSCYAQVLSVVKVGSLLAKDIS